MSSPDEQPVPARSPEYVTLEEAASLFEAAGVFRSLRTLSRYCQHGVLENLKEETPTGAMRYLVTRESVQNRIAEMKQLGMSGHVAPRPDMTGHDATRPDVTGHDETVAELEAKLERAETERGTLRDENMQLKIDVGARSQLLRMAKEDRDQLLADRDAMQRAIGALELQVRQLAAPKGGEGGQVDKPAAPGSAALQ